MIYRAVDDRLAVDFHDLELPISVKKAIEILVFLGFKTIDVDIITEARQLIGKAEYRRAARLREAPAVFDCSGLLKWLYGQIGIWLPRRTIQQREMGEVVDLTQILPGDLIFSKGWIDYYRDDPSDGVGHAGIISDGQSVIHAANSKWGIIESSLDYFTKDGKFRGIRRILPAHGIHVFKTPPEREVDTSDDIRWIILQNL